MSAVYLWSPALTADSKNTIEIVITRGDTDEIGSGTREFAEGILNTIGVDAEVKDWRITPYRSKYFSEYLGEEDWRDNWQVIWKIRIETRRPLARAPSLDRNGIGADVVDDSDSAAKRVKDNAKIRCLVVADFRSAKARDAARESVTAAYTDDIRSKYGVEPPALTSASIPGKLEQLQIDLGLFPAGFYQGGAEYAETIMDICKRAKGRVNFQEP